MFIFFFSSRRRHTRCSRDWSSDVCSSDLISPSCRINRVAAERDIRPKVGRYRLRAGHDERHPFHRVRSGRPVQDRIIAKASANASDSRGRSDAVEKTLYLRQAGGLGFCKQALSRPKTVLGPGDLAQIHTSCSSTSRNSEAIRMAYVPSHLLDLAAKRSEEHTSELQSRLHLVCRLLLEKKK